MYLCLPSGEKAHGFHQIPRKVCDFDNLRCILQLVSSTPLFPLLTSLGSQGAWPSPDPKVKSSENVHVNKLPPFLVKSTSLLPLRLFTWGQATGPRNTNICLPDSPSPGHLCSHTSLRTVDSEELCSCPQAL